MWDRNEATRGGEAASDDSDSTPLSSRSPSNHSLIVRLGTRSCCHSLWVKNETVRLACESRSSSRTFLPRAASPAPRLAVSVVFPTPPLWLMTETTFTTHSLSAIPCVPASTRAVLRAGSRALRMS